MMRRAEPRHGPGLPRRRPWLFPLGVLGLDMVLLFGAVGLGLRIADMQSVDGLPAGWSLDYRSRIGPLAGLNPDFVSQILGDGRDAGLLGTGEVEAGTLDLPGAGLGQRRPGDDLHAPTNDAFEDARSVGALPYEAKTTTNESTRQEAEPSGCGLAGGTLWYRFTPQENIGVIADTLGSDHATALAVYTGTSLEQLTQIACARDVLGRSLVAFPAMRGVTYSVQVGAPSRDADRLVGAGALVFSLARQGITSLVSVGEAGPGNAASDLPVVSADGNHVAFRSAASNLDPRHPVPACHSEFGCGQIYVRDLRRRTTSLVSLSGNGTPGNDQSGLGIGISQPVISADGRFVAFVSFASNLVPGDTNICRSVPSAIKGTTNVVPGRCPDVFVHDRDADEDGWFDEIGKVTTERVSVSSGGQQGDDASGGPSISADGRFVAFTSRASSLVPGDTRVCRWKEPPYPEYNCADVFVHDRLLRTTRLVSRSLAGAGGDGDADGFVAGDQTAISATGRYIAFVSNASDLVPGDTEICPGTITEHPYNCVDAFVHDRTRGTTRRVSISSTGRQSNGHSYAVSISANGRYLAFSSDATNLVPGDTNGALRDVFVHDRDVDRDGRFDEPGEISTVLASLSSRQAQGNVGADRPSISRDGRVVAFISAATNLVPGDMNGSEPSANIGVDVFLRLLRSGKTIRISISSSGSEAGTGGGAYPGTPSMSKNGRILSWMSGADDLVDDDRNASFDVFVHRLTWR